MILTYRKDFSTFPFSLQKLENNFFNSVYAEQWLAEYFCFVKRRMMVSLSYLLKSKADIEGIKCSYQT